jgi:membrane dipeptidase
MTTTSKTPAPPSLADLPSLRDGILSDILLGPPPAGLMNDLDARIRTGFNYISLSMAGDSGATPAAVYARLAQIRYEMSQQPDKFVLVDSVADIRAAKKSNRLAINFHFQGSEAVGRDLANVGAYYKLGVRWMLMAYNFQNNVGTGCLEARKNDIGISQFGKELIAEMNRVGMMVDCTHSGYRTTMDAMSLSTKPCIFSHSNPHALFDHPRNIKDDQIKLCAQTGGVIGINGVGPFMGEPKEVSLDTVVRQIDYIADLVGPEHVALGLDYMPPAFCQMLHESCKGDASAKYAMPSELPWGFMDPADTPLLLAKLLKKGYPVETVRGIMGENFLRVASEVWQ